MQVQLCNNRTAIQQYSTPHQLFANAKVSQLGVGMLLRLLTGGSFRRSCLHAPMEIGLDPDTTGLHKSSIGR